MALIPGPGVGVGRSLLRRGASISPEAKQLFEAYKIAVEADNGQVISDSDTLTLFNDSVKNSLRNNLVFHANGRAGNRLTTPALVAVNKAYSLDENGNNFVQTTGANQPLIHSQGWSFNGSSHHLEGGNPASMQTGGDKTLMAWAKANDMPTGFMAIFGAGWLRLTTGIGIHLSATNFSCQARQEASIATASLAYTASGAPSPTDFFHITGVRRGDVTELFLNGVKVSESSPEPLDTTPLEVWTIGTRRAGIGLEHYFDGIINDCRAYNTALSPAAIATIYNQTKGLYA